MQGQSPPKIHFREAKRYEAMFDLRALQPFKFGIVGNYLCAPNIYICININIYKHVYVYYVINDHTLAVHGCPTFTNTLSTVTQKLGICSVSFTCQSKCSSEMPNEAHTQSPSTTPHWTCLQTRNVVALHLAMQGAVNDQLVTKCHKFCVKNRPIAGFRLLAYCSRQIPNRRVPFEPACQERKPPICWSNLCGVGSKMPKTRLLSHSPQLKYIQLLFQLADSYVQSEVPRLMGFGWLGQYLTQQLPLAGHQ